MCEKETSVVPVASASAFFLVTSWNVALTFFFLISWNIKSLGVLEYLVCFLGFFFLVSWFSAFVHFVHV